MAEQGSNINGHLNISGDQNNHNSEQISIHVVDDVNGVEGTCRCEKALLLRGMKFFQRYFEGKDMEGVTSGITVHCDVDTFQWLLNFIKKEASTEKSTECELKIDNVFSIMVSAEFLEMSSLVDECTKFIIQHFDELNDQPCNTSCFQSKTIERIAGGFKPEDLSSMKESSFKNILFEQKVKDLLKHIIKTNTPPDGVPKLFICAACGLLLTWNVARKVPCLTLRRILDLNGEWVPFHKIQAKSTKDGVPVAPDPESLVDGLHRAYSTWQMTFWCLWNAANCLLCMTCNHYFCPSALTHGCLYHPTKMLEKHDEKMDSMDNVNANNMVPLSSRSSTNSIKKKASAQNKPQVQKRPNVYYPCCGLDACYHNSTLHYTGCASCSHDIRHLLEAEDPIAQLAVTASRWLEVVGKTKVIQPAADGKRPIPRVIGGHHLSSDNCNAFYINKLIVMTAPFNILSHIARPAKSDVNPKDYCAGQLTIDDPLSGEIHIFAPEHMETTQNNHINSTPAANLMVLPKEVDVADSAVWDAAKTTRANQDSQRQDDLRRMKYLTEFLVSLRSPTTDETILTPKQHPGGIFVRLESEWRTKIGLTTTARLPSISRRPRISLNSIPFK